MSIYPQMNANKRKFNLTGPDVVGTLPRLAALNGVVAIGGGTGLGRTLRALSFLGERLTGVVATTDNGGSTGWIREQVGGIAWGDIRHCLNQVIERPSLGSLLLEYRFVDAGELSGQSLGNLIMLALDQLSPRPLHAIDLIREVLHVDLRLVPMSEDACEIWGVVTHSIRRHCGR